MSRWTLILLLLTGRLISQTGCNNADFESTTAGSYTTGNAVTGWSISSAQFTSCNSALSWSSGSQEFSVATTPLLNVPLIGSLANSPLGGSNVAVLNDATANQQVTRLTRTITTGSTNVAFAIAYAASWGVSSTHSCCEQAGFEITFKDSTGVALFCSSVAISGYSCGSPITYTTTSSTAWTNWKVKYIDLSSFTVAPVTIEVVAKDCSGGDHSATLYFDCSCFIPLTGICTCGIPSLSLSTGFCPGASSVAAYAPLGYNTYTWTAPGGYTLSPTQATNASISISNPIAGEVFTVSMTSWEGCVFHSSVPLYTLQVGFAGIGTSSSCPGGASGSATVLASGPYTSYQYNWTNALNQSVGTSSVVNNLPPGSYTVSISAAGQNSSGCTAQSTVVTVGTKAANAYSLSAFYCTGQLAYLRPYTSGSNFQWFDTSGAITATAGGTSSMLTVSNPTNGTPFSLSYLTNQGCHDSITFVPYQVSPGTFTPISNALTCESASTGSVQFLYTSGFGLGVVGYTATPLGTTPGSSVVGAGNPGGMSLTNLLGGGTYSVHMFDGYCLYDRTVAVNTMPKPNFSLSASNLSLCSGASVPVAINFSSTPGVGQYTYSWTPTTWLLGGNGNAQATIINPTTVPGSSASIIYTITVSSTSIQCQKSTTLGVTVSDPPAPIISTVAPMCHSAPPLTLTASPGGGTFMPSWVINQSGIVTPSLITPGTIAYSYSYLSNGCIRTSTSSFVIYPLPSVTITPNLVLCQGQTNTLSALGTPNFTWVGYGQTSTIAISPTVSSSYTVLYNSAPSCSNTQVVQVTVAPNPTLIVLGNHPVCNGDTLTLSAGGAQGYSWSNGTTGSPIIFVPTQTSTYVLTGYNSVGNCSASAPITVTFFPQPQLNLIYPTEICRGQQGMIIGAPANSYTWNGTAGSNSFVITPSVNAYYEIKAESPDHCRSTTYISINVRNCEDALSLSSYDMVETKAFPNPFNTQLIIHAKQPGILKIHNAIGELVYSSPFRESETILDLHGLNPGSYFLSIDGKILGLYIKLSDD